MHRRRSPGTDPKPLRVAVADPNGVVMDAPAAPLSAAGSDSDASPFPMPAGIPGPAIQPGSRYIGAGIVQRLPEGGYVLATAAGKKLAQIEGTESVALEEFVGKQVGLHGKRWFRDDIGSDFIEVSGLEPVRIR